ncbi:unnamed protein product [Auanema sp. JU1783]|nr:unnamed protein product [Auanema sp. JU1783]
MARSLGWLLSPFSVLKLSQMICLLLIIVFFLDGRQQWRAYNIIFLFSFIFLICDFVTLVLHYFEVPKTSNNLPWLTIEKVWNIVVTVLSFVAVLVLAWDWYQMKNNRTRHHALPPPMTIGRDGWMRKLIIVSVVSLITGILFLMSYLRVKRYGIH